MTSAEQILAALGGTGNVNDISSCITRLRVSVTDAENVSEDALKDAGAFGVVIHGRTVQVVVGPEADDLAAEISHLR
ncbi:MAG TPA: PTS glucose/sucrose transporter subunit IIB [Actinomycetaceae bacterium]|nr:PTS glucose/sucrose transporter subunit IIB [Actinomycetaceae bacterium]